MEKEVAKRNAEMYSYFIEEHCQNAFLCFFDLKKFDNKILIRYHVSNVCVYAANIQIHMKNTLYACILYCDNKLFKYSMTFTRLQLLCSIKQHAIIYSY